jgi:hypothetical protein
MARRRQHWKCTLVRRIKSNKLDSQMNQYLTLFHSQLLPLLTHLPLFSIPHKCHQSILHFHWQTQFPKLLDHANGMRLNLKFGQHHRFGRHLSRPTKSSTARLAKYSTTSLDVQFVQRMPTLPHKLLDGWCKLSAYSSSKLLPRAIWSNLFLPKKSLSSPPLSSDMEEELSLKWRCTSLKWLERMFS